MGKEKFIYNTQTLRYEKVVEPLSRRIFRIAGFICAALFTAFIFTLIAQNFLTSPQETALRKENDRLANQIATFNKRYEDLAKVVQNIQERDAQAHRMIFGMEPIDEGVWEGGVGGHDRYDKIKSSSSYGELLAETHQRVDKLARQLVIQSKSLDTILTKAKEKEEMLASMPSIKPVRSDQLKRHVSLLSGFGMRIHPIHKVRKMHTGIDFSAPTGTAIQATGNGTVVEVDYKRTGYGHHVVIDHGYGFKTLYGHMNEVNVKVGEKVKRGQKIGEVGSTGTSTAPHCHYEVHLKGSKVNPIHYCMDGLSPEEYQELVDAASRANQSFD